MKAFRDNEDRTWELELTFGSAKRVRDLLGVDLMALEAGEPPLLTRLGTDVMLLCDVVFCLLKPQADAKGLTDEQWAAGMGGEAILAAQTAFYEEMQGFFRSRGRKDLATALAKQHRMIDLAVEMGDAQMARIDPESELGAAFGAAGTSSLPPSG